MTDDFTSILENVEKEKEEQAVVKDLTSRTHEYLSKVEFSAG